MVRNNKSCFGLCKKEDQNKKVSYDSIRPKSRCNDRMASTELVLVLVCNGNEYPHITTNCLSTAQLNTKELMIKLSILICSLKSRKILLDNFLHDLNLQITDQITDQVEVLTDIDEGEVSIGAKRQRLLDKAKGKYIAFADDDDHLAPTYVKDILEAIEYSPDVIGFIRQCNIMGEFHSNTYLTTIFPPLSPHVQTPLHINVWKAEIAKSEKFADSNRGEDHCWANRCLKQVQNEKFINRTLYFYEFTPLFNRSWDADCNSRRQMKILVDLGIVKPKKQDLFMETPRPTSKQSIEEQAKEFAEVLKADLLVGKEDAKPLTYVSTAEQWEQEKKAKEFSNSQHWTDTQPTKRT